jgi:enamine deaminase RidA (YjgF/YER057c/UK114 family)
VTNPPLTRIESPQFLKGGDLLSHEHPIIHCHKLHTMKRAITPASLRRPFAAYSYAVEISTPTRFLFASGLLGVSPDDVVPEGRRGAGGAVLRKYRKDPRRAGMSFADVVRFSAFVTDRAYFPVYGKDAQPLCRGQRLSAPRS